MQLTPQELDAPWFTDSAAGYDVPRRYVYSTYPGEVIAETRKDVYELIRQAPDMYACLYDAIQAMDGLPHCADLVARIRRITDGIEHCYKCQKEFEAQKRSR